MCMACLMQPVTRFSEDPKLEAPREIAVHEARMGDIIRPGTVAMRLVAEVIGTAPIEQVDVLHGTNVVKTVRPYAAADLGRRVRVRWEGAEYRGRGRETIWQGRLTLTGNRILRFAPVNFLNPERKLEEVVPGTVLAWNSVTTGNLAGIDIWLDEARSGTLSIETNVVSGTWNSQRLPTARSLTMAAVSAVSSMSIAYPKQTGLGISALEHNVIFPGGADLPVYIRVTQADCHQAWSSPIYLIE